MKLGGAAIGNYLPQCRRNRAGGGVSGRRGVALRRRLPRPNSPFPSSQKLLHRRRFVAAAEADESAED